MASIIKTALASVMGLGLTLGVATVPAFAQSNGGFDDLSGDSNSNEVFGGSDVTLTDLLHRSRRTDAVSRDEFGARADENIEEAAADLNQRRQNSLETQSGAAVETPEVEEQL